MDISQWIGNGFLMLVGVLLPLLWIKEVLVWKRDLQSARKLGFVHMRLLRRSIGVGLLLSIVLLLKFPRHELLTEMQQLIKLLICLTLSLVVFVVAIWDMNVIRVGMQLEVEEIGLKSAQELQRVIAEVTKDAQSASSEGQKED